MPSTEAEVELIEMRYQQWLSIMALEDLFIEGEIDAVWSDHCGAFVA